MAPLFWLTFSKLSIESYTTATYHANIRPEAICVTIRKCMQCMSCKPLGKMECSLSQHKIPSSHEIWLLVRFTEAWWVYCDQNSRPPQRLDFTENLQALHRFHGLIRLYASTSNKQIPTLWQRQCMWLQPPFFCTGALHAGHAFVFVLIHCWELWFSPPLFSSIYLNGTESCFGILTRM